MSEVKGFFLPLFRGGRSSLRWTAQRSNLFSPETPGLLKQISPFHGESLEEIGEEGVKTESS